MSDLQNPVLQKTDREPLSNPNLKSSLNFLLTSRKWSSTEPRGSSSSAGSAKLRKLLSPRGSSGREWRGASGCGYALASFFWGSHIKDSYSIWARGLPSFAGWVLPYDKPILLVLEEKEQLEIAVRYLVRLGYDNIAGFLNGGILAWYMKALPVDGFNFISVYDLKNKLEKNEEMALLDVRTKKEWDKGHIKGARHIYVGDLEENLDKVPKESQVIVYCDSSRRSSIAASILNKYGYNNISNLLGSMSAWKNAGYDIVK